MKRLFGALFVVALLIPVVGAPAGAAESEQRLLSVNGEGTVRAKPDMAIITLGVVSEAKAASAALSENTTSMSGIVDALKAAGIESRDLQTSGFSVEPVYSQRPNSSDASEPFVPEIVSYRVSNNLTLRVRALDDLGAILDKVVNLGANAISGPTFTVADPTPLEDQAKQAAIRDALRKGRLYAQAAAVQLGAIYRIDEGYSGAPQPMAAPMLMRMEAAGAKAVPVEGGELTFNAQVSVSWLLDD
jgi:uncharacterized protein YggE